MSGLLFANNTGAGLVTLSLTASTKLSGLVFLNNSSPYSFAPACLLINFQVPASLSISQSRFDGNYALATTLAYLTGLKEMQLDAITAFNNSARTTSAGFYVEVHPLINSSISVRDSTFEGNSGNSSGVIVATMAGDSYARLTEGLLMLVHNCTFTRNSGTTNGACISLLGLVHLKHSLISASKFSENDCRNGGAGVYAEYSAGTLTVDSCIFEYNRGLDGAALYHRFVGSANSSLMRLHASQLRWNNGSSIVMGESTEMYNLTSEHNTFEKNIGSSVHVIYGKYQDTGSRFLYNSAKHGAVLWSEKILGFVRDFYGEGNSASTNGGVLYATKETTLSCDNCTFLNNSATVIGGALYLDQLSTFYCSDFLMVGNFAGDRGAALFTHRSVIVGQRGELRANRAGSYGTIFVSAATLNLSQIDMSRNESPSRSPGIVGTLATINVDNCTFHDQYGPKGGSFFLTDQSVGIIYNSRVWNNTSGSGGAFVVIALSSISIRDTIMWNCSATTDGGLLTSRISTIEFVRSTAVNMTSTLTFGAVFLLQSSWIVSNSILTDMVGSAAYGMASDVTIRDSYFARVFAGIGAGLNCAECTSLYIANSTFDGGLAKVGGVINTYTMGTSTSVLKSAIYNSTFMNSRAVDGGAISSDSFYMTLIGNTFLNNSASPEHYDPTGLLVRGKGGAVYMVCPSIVFCEFIVRDNRFENNKAEHAGGAVFWSDSFPTASNNTMVDNHANYGSNIASFAVRLARLGPNSTIDPYLESGELPLVAHYTDVPSGQIYNGTLTVALLDQYDQVVTSDFSSSAQLVANSSEASVSGTTQVVAEKGVFFFSNITIVGAPLSSQDLLVVTNGIDLSKQKTAKDPSAYFQTVRAQVDFRACEIGESLQSNMCQLCPVNTFSLNPADPCMSCPSHSTCYGSFLMVPDSGYWRPDPLINLFFECLNKDACLGSPDPSNPSLTGTCAKGYSNNLCSLCDPDYSAQGSGICKKCPSLTSNLVYTSFMILGVLLSFVIIVAVAIRGAQRPRSELAIFIKILMNYLQMIIVASSLNLNWPNYVATFLRGQQLAGNAADQMMSIECLLKQFSSDDVYYTNVAVYIIVPGVVMAVSMVFWVAAWLVSGSELVAQKLIVTLVLVVFVLHTSVTKVVFSMLTCRELLPGEFWLASNLSIPCWNQKHMRNILMLGLPGIGVWVIGLPTICLLILIRNRRVLNDPQVRLSFSFLFKGYRSEWYFWEFVILYRKIIVVCTSVFLTTVSIVVQALSMLAVVLVCLFLQQYVKPFFGENFNKLELRALLASLLTIYAGLYFQTNSTSTAYIEFEINILFFVVMIVANAYFILSWLRMVIPIVVITLRERLTALRTIKTRPRTTSFPTEKSRQNSQISGEVMNTQVTPCSQLHESVEPPQNTSFLRETPEKDPRVFPIWNIGDVEA